MAPPKRPLTFLRAILMTKPLIPWTEQELRTLATKVIFARGEAYFNEGQVTDLSFDADQQDWTADVTGNQTYEVVITVGDSKPDAFCDCPYEGWPCKHIVAVALALEDQQERLQQEQTVQERQQDLLRACRRALSFAELQKLMLQAQAQIPEMKQFLELQLLQDTRAALGSVKKKIHQIVKSLDRGGSLAEAARQLKALWVLAQNPIQMPVLLEILDQGLELLSEYEIYDTPLDNFLADALQEWVGIYRQDADLSREAGLKVLMHHYAQGNMLEDNVYAAVQQLMQTEAERRLVLQALQEMALQRNFHSRYLSTLIADLQAQIGSDAERLAYLSQQLEDGTDYWRLAQHWLEKSENEKAWEVVQ